MQETNCRRKFGNQEREQMSKNQDYTVSTVYMNGQKVIDPFETSKKVRTVKDALDEYFERETKKEK